MFVILLDVSDIYEGRHDSDTYYSFSSETVNTTVIKCTYIVCTSFTNMRLFFHKFSISNTFLQLCMRFCMPVVSNHLPNRRNSSRTLCFGSSSFAKRRPRSASFRGAKEMKSEGAEQGVYGNEHLIYLPVCLNLRTSCFNIFSVRTFLCGLR